MGYTTKQRDILEFIADHQRVHAVSRPSSR